MNPELVARPCLHSSFKDTPVETWIDLVADSMGGANPAGHLPWSAPSEEIQSIFNGVSGSASIRAAGKIYKHTLELLRRNGIGKIGSLLDFGCGWGRFTRLFSRDVPNAQLFAVDPWEAAIRLCRSRMPSACFVQSPHEPPLPFRDGCFDVVFANSVFSHLAEPTARAWFAELARVIRPGGLLVATTHGCSFIALLRSLAGQDPGQMSPWHKSLSRYASDSESVDGRLTRGEFVFLATGTADAANSTYGDALIPFAWLDTHCAPFYKLVDFTDEPALLPQATFALQKI